MVGQHLGNPSHIQLAILKSLTHDGIESWPVNFWKRITRHRNREPTIFSNCLTHSVDIRFLPWLAASWTFVRPASKFLYHCCTLLLLVKVSPYTLLFHWWISVELLFLAWRILITARTSHLVGDYCCRQVYVLTVCPELTSVMWRVFFFPAFGRTLVHNNFHSLNMSTKQPTQSFYFWIFINFI